jgi:hypothetical protein
VADREEWHPGSFTKNFSWGPADRGLRELYDVIRTGFDGRLEDVPRRLFRERVKASGRPDYIPLNFFLFNKIKAGVDHVVVDELVFQAINFRHSNAFDKLALFAFNLSMVGHWRAEKPYQSRPALWAFHYVADRLGPELGWDARRVSADDIQHFISTDDRYKAKTSRKVATNLNYLYKQGKIADLRSYRPERWWLSALFLALDRMIEEKEGAGRIVEESRYAELLVKSGFYMISGRRSIEKDLAAGHFVELYAACGGRSRFSEEAVRERQKILLKEISAFANDPNPIGVFHPSNPAARNAIPRACAMLAHYLAGFEWFDIDELDDFDVATYVKDRTRLALNQLKQRNIAPSMSAEELLRLTRGE